MPNEVDWAEANAIGRAEADALIQRMRETRCPLEFVRKLDPDAQCNAQETGFMFEVAARLIGCA